MLTIREWPGVYMYMDSLRKDQTSNLVTEPHPTSALFRTPNLLRESRGSGPLVSFKILNEFNTRPILSLMIKEIYNIGFAYGPGDIKFDTDATCNAGYLGECRASGPLPLSSLLPGIGHPL